jgi:hypothetical protein
MEQWCWSAGVLAKQQVELAPKIRIASSPHELSRQLLERRNQSFRNVAAAELTPMAVFVGFACCDHKCCVMLSEAKHLWLLAMSFIAA